MIYLFLDGRKIDIGIQLGECIAAFKERPSSMNWKRMQLAMLSYQQFKYNGDQRLIFNMKDMDAAAVYAKCEELKDIL